MFVSVICTVVTLLTVFTVALLLGPLPKGEGHGGGESGGGAGGDGTAEGTGSHESLENVDGRRPDHHRQATATEDQGH
ncbi:hypothetical protein AB0R12_04655 [Streptomyces niveus]|uniref:hypothetical protein n=1 Tax=Streptomyces niveus TaxID=193462 RepID=UPI00341DAC21